MASATNEEGQILENHVITTTVHETLKLESEWSSFGRQETTNPCRPQSLRQFT